LSVYGAVELKAESFINCRGLSDKDRKRRKRMGRHPLLLLSFWYQT